MNIPRFSLSTGFSMSKSSINFLLGVICLGLTFSMNAWTKTPQPTLTPAAFKVLEASQELLSEEKYSLAIEKLKKQYVKEKDGSYSRALLLQFLGYSYLLKEQWSPAAKFFDLALKQNALPVKTQLQVIQGYVHARLATDQYRKVIARLSPWLKDNGHSPDVPAALYVQLGMSYLYLDKPQQAINPLREGIRREDKPKASWYETLLVSYFKSKRFKEARLLIDDMIRVLPAKEDYWRQLSILEIRREQFKRALVVYELANKEGFLNKPNDIRQHARLLIQEGAPYRAARLIDTSIKSGRLKPKESDWKLLANSWIQAKEIKKALPALNNSANLSSTGEAHLRIAQLYIDKESWGKAITHLNKALKKGNLKDTGHAYLLLGIARLEIEDWQRATKALKKAKTYNKQKRSATQWLSFIQRKTEQTTN